MKFKTEFFHVASIALCFLAVMLIFTPAMAAESGSTVVTGSIGQPSISITVPTAAHINIDKSRGIDSSSDINAGIIDVQLTNCFPTESFTIHVVSDNNGFLTNAEGHSLSQPLKVMVQDDNNFVITASGTPTLLHTEANAGYGYRQNELILMQSLSEADRTISGEFAANLIFTATMV